MRIKYLLFFLVFLFLVQFVKSQPVKPANPGLRARLMKYVMDNRLNLADTYVYFDTATKKPYRFSPKDLLAEEAGSSRQTPDAHPQPVISPANNLQGGVSNFHLIKDVNALTDAGIRASGADDGRYAFVTLNNVAYFVANDGIHGLELWRSDGTAAGTYLVIDLAAGETSSSPFNLTVSGSQLFFAIINTTAGGFELWKTDGTAAGTAVVKTFLNSEQFSGPPGGFCSLNGTLYFPATNTNYLSQLWKSDGTAAGTVLVKDFNESGTSFLRSMVAVDSLLYFVAFDFTHGSELWRSNGTDMGSYLVKDIDPGNDFLAGGPVHLTPFDHKLYFSERDIYNASDGKLWITDGTAAGTVRADENSRVLLPQPFTSNLYQNVPFPVDNGVIYFSGRDYISFNDTLFPNIDGLYKYNTASPAARIETVKTLAIFPSTYYGDRIYIRNEDIVAINGSIYFSYSDTASTFLYKTSAASNTSLLLKTFANYLGIADMTNGNGALYFSAVPDSAYSSEPWISNGTAEGTVLLKDIYPGIVGSKCNAFTFFNNKLLFAATDPEHGNELWSSDGTSTQLLKDINQTATSNSVPLLSATSAPLKDGLLTIAQTYEKGYEPVFATANDVTVVKDIFANEPSSSPHDIVVKNNTGYFVAQVPAVNTPDAGNGVYFNGGIRINMAVFKTDGTNEGTVQITPSINGNVYNLAVTDNGTVFYVINRTGREELWKNNGTRESNVLLHQSPQYGFFINTSYDPATFKREVFAMLGNTVFFSAIDYNTPIGFELWKSDGTPEGTIPVKDINPGSGHSNPSHLTTFNNEVFFDAYDNTGYALWKTDGTEAGTIKLKAVEPVSFAVSNNTLFFAGTDVFDSGTELWKTDGTMTGTQLVKDIRPGGGNGYPLRLTDVNGTLFFQASDSTEHVQLWKSDGTTAGTTLVKDIAPGPDATILGSFTSAAGQLYFVASNKLWLSNGTEAGTGPVADDVLNGLQVGSVVANENQLFLDAYNYKYGYELYTGNATLAVLPVTLVSFKASLKNNDVITQWQTSSEVNTSYFNVQRSTDGVHFTDAGKVMAKGSDDTYSFTDMNIANLVLAKTIYYRLQTVDNDGSITLSKVAPVDLKRKDAIVVLLPNPVKDVLRVRVNNYNGKAAISVFDANGKNVYVTQKTVQSGNDIIINTSILQSGVYVMKVSLDGKVIQQKFVKE